MEKVKPDLVVPATLGTDQEGNKVIILHGYTREDCDKVREYVSSSGPQHRIHCDSVPLCVYENLREQ